jgi:hypothetical protein
VENIIVYFCVGRVSELFSCGDPVWDRLLLRSFWASRLAPRPWFDALESCSMIKSYVVAASLETGLGSTTTSGLISP